ncbi:MAG: hypothetical protein P1U77_00605 [Rubripirellula sp.]|jgi:hypothetical protein|nr:hypothetical protein [Planctomycetaceae bacterium]MDF1839902.1 hypothetical protein [Rubripirellula sp.]
MNTTTFTIESVHGVKQTIVLGPEGRVPTGNQTPENSSGSSANQTGAKTTASAARH